MKNVVQSSITLSKMDNHLHPMIHKLWMKSFKMDKQILNPNQIRKLCNYRTISCDNIAIIKQFYRSEDCFAMAD